jgi:formylglycine-generating enzyme
MFGKFFAKSFMMIVVLASTLGVARGNVFDMSGGQKSLDFVAVGNPGNSGYAAVDYSYAIGKYEVTAGQYCEFLNAKAKTDPYGLYNEEMTSTYGCMIHRIGDSGDYTYTVASNYADRPVNYVGFWDACRFANWLNNGQEDGSTEDGAYPLDGYNGANGRTIHRNSGAQYWIPGVSEWCKAAYHKNNGPTGNYWKYPTRTDAVPGRDLSELANPGNNANYYGSPFPIDSGAYYTTTAGEFQLSAGPYGTFDQGGNVLEWNDSVLHDSSRGLRGGSFNIDYYEMDSSHSYSYFPTIEFLSFGFRVASVPEPSAFVLLVIAALGLLARAWLRRKPG